MNARAVDLLKSLGAGIRPDGAAPTQPQQPVESAEFARLLQQAETGDLHSGRRVAPGGEVEYELTQEQIDRLSRTADAAEAAGATRLLAMIDGRGAVIDVASRRVEQMLDPAPDAEASPSPSDVLTGIDAAAMAPTSPADENSEEPAAPRRATSAAVDLAGLARTENASLADLLAEGPNAPDRAGDG